VTVADCVGPSFYPQAPHLQRLGFSVPLYGELGGEIEKRAFHDSIGWICMSPTLHTYFRLQASLRGFVHEESGHGPCRPAPLISVIRAHLRPRTPGTISKSHRVIEYVKCALEQAVFGGSHELAALGYKLRRFAHKSGRGLYPLRRVACRMCLYIASHWVTVRKVTLCAHKSR